MFYVSDESHSTFGFLTLVQCHSFPFAFFFLNSSEQFGLFFTKGLISPVGQWYPVSDASIAFRTKMEGLLWRCLVVSASKRPTGCVSCFFEVVRCAMKNILEPIRNTWTLRRSSCCAHCPSLLFLKVMMTSELFHQQHWFFKIKKNKKNTKPLNNLPCTATGSLRFLLLQISLANLY